MYTLDGQRMTGVTTVLSVIAKPALIGWAANMAVDYVKDYIKVHPDVRGQDQLDKLLVVVEEARTAHTKAKEKAGDVGTLAHKKIEVWIKEQIALHK